MFLIDCDSAEAYLRESGRLAPGEAIRVRQLAGGVSNEVLYVERGDAALGDFVLKQARPQLRVADPWFCSVERIWREVETMRVCAAALEKADSRRSDLEEAGVEVSIPHVLFEDRENYAFGMTAAPPHEVWKQRLLAGAAEPAIAAACGRLLADLHAGTWQDQEVAIRLQDRSFFEDLRVDPYYRRIAEAHADLQQPIAELIRSLAANGLCLVHGDFSPKNLLVYERSGEQPCLPAEADATGMQATSKAACRYGLMLVDFEVGHYGDPAFDLGFFLSHLTLKSFWSGPRFDEYFRLTESFWRPYLERMNGVADSAELRELAARGIRNFAACMLARIDGKSKVEYLTDETLRETIRRHARKLLLDSPKCWEDVRRSLKQTI